MKCASRLAWGALGALLVMLAPARADDGAERARIGQERADARARFEQRQRECALRFAVTPCVEEARAEHRQALMRLRRQEGLLDEAQRKQRAAARLAAIEEKQRSEREPGAAPRAERRPVPLQVKPPRPGAAAPRAASAAASAAAGAPQAEAREQRSRARFEARQRDARAHREQAEQRRAKREASGKASAPLPEPGAR